MSRRRRKRGATNSSSRNRAAVALLEGEDRSDNELDVDIDAEDSRSRNLTRSLEMALIMCELLLLNAFGNALKGSLKVSKYGALASLLYDACYQVILLLTIAHSVKEYCLPQDNEKNSLDLISQHFQFELFQAINWRLISVVTAFHLIGAAILYSVCQSQNCSSLTYPIIEMYVFF